VSVGASIVISLTAFAGVIMLVPAVSGRVKPTHASALCTGVLLSVATMIMWPEAMSMIPCHWELKESQTSTIFGVMTMLGFITPALVN
jgi:hypothetical protein